MHPVTKYAQSHSNFAYQNKYSNTKESLTKPTQEQLSQPAYDMQSTNDLAHLKAINKEKTCGTMSDKGLPNKDILKYMKTDTKILNNVPNGPKENLFS